jgi:hypothetical protein
MTKNVPAHLEKAHEKHLKENKIWVQFWDHLGHLNSLLLGPACLLPTTQPESSSKHLDHVSLFFKTLNLFLDKEQIFGLAPKSCGVLFLPTSASSSHTVPLLMPHAHATGHFLLPQGLCICCFTDSFTPKLLFITSPHLPPQKNCPPRPLESLYTIACCLGNTLLLMSTAIFLHLFSIYLFLWTISSRRTKPVSFIFLSFKSWHP